MATPIRIRFETDGSGTITGFEGITKNIERSLNAVSSRLQKNFLNVGKIGGKALSGMFAGLNTELAKVNSHLARTEQLVSRIGRFGGGGAAGGRQRVNLNTLLSTLIGKEGFGLSGRHRLNAARTGQTITQEYINALGRKLMASYNAKGQLSGLAMGLQPNVTPAQQSLHRMLALSRRGGRADFRFSEFEAAFGRTQKLAADEALYDRLARDDAMRRAQGIIGDRGLRMRSFKTQIGADGPYQIQQFNRGAGFFRDAESLRLNTGTGKFAHELKLNTSLWGRFVKSVTGDGHIIDKALRTAWSSLTGVPRMITSVGNGFIRLAATIYSIERVGRFMKEIFAAPLRYIIESTERSREFEAAISGVAGGLGRARQINEALVTSNNYSDEEQEEDEDEGDEADVRDADDPELEAATAAVREYSRQVARSRADAIDKGLSS